MSLFPPLALPFASVGQAKHLYDVALSPNHIAKTLAGTSVYTVSNMNNEFVLISDPNDGAKSIGLLCFRRQDAEALLAQVLSFVCSVCLSRNLEFAFSVGKLGLQLM